MKCGLCESGTYCEIHDPPQDVAPTEGDIRVWWVPQVPMEAFYVSVPDALIGRIVEETLAQYDLFQLKHNVKPDFCNAGGLQRYEADGDSGFDWVDLEYDDDF